MSSRRRRALSAAALFLATLLAAATAPAGDDDERPAYMIYIDPETGKYTTQDPYADAPETATPEIAPRAAPAPIGTESSVTWLRIAAAALAAVALLAFLGRRQLRLHRNS